MTLFKRAAAGVSVLALLAVSACAGESAQQIAQSVLTDTSTIASAFQAEMPAIEAIQGVPAADVTKAQAALADLQTVTGTLNTSLTATAAQPIIERVVADVEAFNAAVLPFVGGTPVASVLEAANVLMPVIEIAVGLSAPAGAAANALTPDEARVVLQAAAAK
jgi:hypothetical protein